MALFISYSSQDRSTVDALTNALRRAKQDVWFDQELGGGDSWWATILEQIRACDVFVVALSSNWLQSKPSQSELRYAQALNRPILPVRIGDIDSMRVNPLAALQIIDYRDPTVDAGIQLVTAVHGMTANSQPLPEPLPAEPPVPFGYITRLGNTLAEKEISPQQQLQLLIELRSGLDEDGDDPSARGDIAQLLRMLRLRHDVTYRTRSEIDNVLAEIEEKHDKKQDASTSGDASTQVAAAAPASSPAPTPPSAVAAGGGSNKRLMIIGGAALAVVAAIILVVVLTTQGGKTKPAPKAAAPGSAANSAPSAGPNVGGNPIPNPGASSGSSPLLGTAEIGPIVGATNALVVVDGTTQLRTLRVTLSNPGCIGAYEPITETAYNGAAGYVSVSGQSVQSPGEEPAHRVYEAVATFASPENAAAFVQSSAEKWQPCADETLTATTPKGKTLTWNFSDIVGAPPKIELEKAEPGGRTCHHVLHAVSKSVIDVIACSPDAGTGQAGKIAELISAKVSG
jgi:hypothetical protein